MKMMFIMLKKSLKIHQIDADEYTYLDLSLEAFNDKTVLLNQLIEDSVFDNLENWKDVRHTYNINPFVSLHTDLLLFVFGMWLIYYNLLVF